MGEGAKISVMVITNYKSSFSQQYSLRPQWVGQPDSPASGVLVINFRFTMAMCMGTVPYRAQYTLQISDLESRGLILSCKFVTEHIVSAWIITKDCKANYFVRLGSIIIP